MKTPWRFVSHRMVDGVHNYRWHEDACPGNNLVEILENTGKECQNHICRGKAEQEWPRTKTETKKMFICI